MLYSVVVMYSVGQCCSDVQCYAVLYSVVVMYSVVQCCSDVQCCTLV